MKLRENRNRYFQMENTVLYSRILMNMVGMTEIEHQK